MDTDSRPSPEQPAADGGPPAGTKAGIVAGCGLGVLSLLCLVGMGVAAATMRESDSVTASYLLVPFVPVGLVAVVAAFVTRKKSTGAAVGVPLGCGCLTWIFGLVAMIVFFQLIWPSL